MDDLTAFLRARLDEDEAAAKAVEDNSEPWPGQWDADGNYALRTHNGWVLAAAGTPGSEFKPGVLAHIARHDPARVLREVGAKRKMVKRAAEARELAEGDRQAKANHGPDRGPCLPFSEQRERTYWEVILPYLAEVYTDHPDFRPEWKP